MAEGIEEITERSVLLDHPPPHLDGSIQSLAADRQQQDVVSGDEMCIMVAGKPGNGKSTALNNIFELDLVAKISSRSVTTKIEIKKVTKNKKDLVIIDTPGLGALDLEKEMVTTAMIAALRGMDYTLLYCLSIGPGNRLTEMDKTIIRNLHAILGKEVWGKCVILFTFSDTARRECFSLQSQVSEYKEYLKDVAIQLSSILKECSSDVPTVKSVFECEGNDRVEGEKEIIAIPVGKYVDGENEPDILPGILEPTEDWTDRVFAELLRKTKPRQRISFTVFKYGAAMASGIGSSAMAGAVVGAGAGAAVGAVAGPVGILVAGAVGAGVGAGVGVVASVSIASIMAAIRHRKRSKCIKKLLPNEGSSS